MSFKGSALLSKLNSLAPASAVEDEVRKLCTTLDCTELSVIKSLASVRIRTGKLVKMRISNGQIAEAADGDHLAKMARKVWAAETLVNTVLSPYAYTSHTHDPQIADLMKRGAEGLYQLGRVQFKTLDACTRDIATWLKDSGVRNVTLIESPLGNSVPTQVLHDIAVDKGLTTETLTLNAPRNVRSSAGRTIKQAVEDLVPQLIKAECVIYLDEVLSGTRFIKLHEVLQSKIGERLVGVAMVFHYWGKDGQITKSTRLHDIEKRLKKQQAPLEKTIRIFDWLPSFKLTSDTLAQLQPVIWGGLDLPAGKRKANVIFTLMEHAFAALEDLTRAESAFAPYLRAAWEMDVEGQRYGYSEELRRSTFSELVDKLKLGELQVTLFKEAAQHYPQDYKGEINDLGEEKVMQRGEWLTEKLQFLASKRGLNDMEAGLLRNALSVVLFITVQTNHLQPDRDHGYSTYVIPYKKPISAFNQHLRYLIRSRSSGGQ
jgi:hypothetical protein